MMDHEGYRSAMLSDPHDPDPALRAHREGCAECSAFTEQLLRFESRLVRALRIDIVDAEMRPAAGVVRLADRAPARPRRWMALAATVLLGAVVAGGLWVVLPGASLAAAVVAHMAGEPDAWRAQLAVPGPALNTVLRDSKLRLAPSAGIVSYASSCEFRGHVVPHLVVQTGSGPVTVMVLVHEPARKVREFDEHGYRGTIVPMPGHGSIAVLMLDPGSDRATVERVAARVRDSIVWTSDPGLSE
jgi:Protein of unknown function (DUF3379)